MKINDSIRLALEEIDKGKEAIAAATQHFESPADEWIAQSVSHSLAALEQITQAVDAINSKIGGGGI